MNETPDPDSTATLQPGTGRGLTRALALALLCAALQALLPAYTLGTAVLPPLSVVLGVVVAAAMARGRWTVPAALLGVLAADIGWRGLALPTAMVGAAVLGLQAMLTGWLMRHAADAELMQLDTWPRLQRFVLVAAPAAALVGVLGSLLLQAGLDAAAAQPLARPQLAGAVGRFIADAAGIIVTAPVLLCWLGRPLQAWRPRRRLVALPLLLLVAGLLPGVHELARRDEARLQVAFDREANLRRVRVQQLLAAPVDAVLTLRGVVQAGRPQQDTLLFDQLSAGWMDRIPGLLATGWLARNGTGADDIQLRHARLQKAETAALPGARLAADGKLVLEPPLAQAAVRALEQPGQPVVLPLAQPAGGTGATQLLVLQAVPAAADAAGPAALVFARIDGHVLLDPALPDDSDPNLRVCLLAPGVGPAPARRVAGPPGCDTDVAARALRAVPYALTLGGQRLDLLVTEPVTAENRLFTAVWLLALPAVTGTALLAALLLALTGRLRRIEDRVRERTAALQTEVDERRQAEARLAVSEQRFRAIFDSVTIGVTVVDPAGQITEVNPAFCQMMGCQPADLLHKPLADFRLPDVAEDDGTAAAMGGGAARRQRYLTPDGRVLQVAASLRTLHDAAGAPVASLLPDARRRLRFFVPETAIATLKPGQKVEARCDGCTAPIRGAIDFIAPQAEYTPPVIYSRGSREKLVFRVEAAAAPVFNFKNDLTMALVIVGVEGAIDMGPDSATLARLRAAAALADPTVSTTQDEFRVQLADGSVRWLVSRDVSALSETQVRESAIETLAETRKRDCVPQDAALVATAAAAQTPRPLPHPLERSREWTAAVAAGTRTALTDSNVEFIEKASGIKRRYVMNKSGVLDPRRMRPEFKARPDTEISMMAEIAVKAAQDALANAGKTAADVDGVYCAAANMQRAYPAMGVEIQTALGINGYAFDMNVACSSATFALEMAYNAVRTGSARAILVVNPEITSAHLAWMDRDCHFIFGDVCTATVVERADEARSSDCFEILGTKLSTQFSNNIRNNFGFMNRAEDSDPNARDKTFRQEGRKVFKEVVPMAAAHIDAHLKSLQFEPTQVKRYWLHQANLGMNQLVLKKLVGREVGDDIGRVRRRHLGRFVARRCVHRRVDPLVCGRVDRRVRRVGHVEHVRDVHARGRLDEVADDAVRRVAALGGKAMRRSVPGPYSEFRSRAEADLTSGPRPVVDPRSSELLL